MKDLVRALTIAMWMAIAYVVITTIAAIAIYG